MQPGKSFNRNTLMTKDVRILIICYYQGKFSNYIDYFLGSCVRNKNLNFLILSDEVESRRVENVEYQSMTLHDFNQKATDALGLKIELDRGFKVCDLRPAYGEIFKDEIASYDYWGFCDFDTILGRTSDFLDVLTREEIDVFASTPGWNSGSFSVYRNTEEVNKLFRSNDHWKVIFSDNKYYGFDECCQRWSNPLDPLNPGEELFSIYDLLRLPKNKHINAIYRDVVIEWPKDIKSLTLSREGWINQVSGQKFMYLHLLLMKNSWRFYLPKYSSANSDYYVSGMGLSYRPQKGVSHFRWLVERMIHILPKIVKSICNKSKAEILEKIRLRNT